MTIRKNTDEALLAIAEQSSEKTAIIAESLIKILMVLRQHHAEAEKNVRVAAAEMTLNVMQATIEVMILSGINEDQISRLIIAANVDLETVATLRRAAEVQQ